MTKYIYEAEKWNGEKVKGHIDAGSQAEVRVRVRNMGYKILAIREYSANKEVKNQTLQSLSLKENLSFRMKKAGVSSKPK